VLPHAADLFAERGPVATSLRDIAARSGVNQGLIFRHIGNKEAVVAAVLDYVAEDLAAALEVGDTNDDLEAKVERSWKVIARALLDGFDVGQLQRRFPNVEALLDVAGVGGADDAEARIAAAHALAMQLGWRLFGPFLRAATGLQDVPAEKMRRSLDARMAAMLGNAAQSAEG
jgi:AcrR family transcriptional regulator